MASTFRCDIVSAEEEIFHGEATLLVATGEIGELGIAPKHAPLITRLKPGKIVVTLPSGEQLDFAVTGGILEVQPSQVTILADTALRAEQLDEAAADEARRKAEEALKGAVGKEDLAHAQMQLVEAAARYRAAQKLKGKRREL